MGDFDGRITQLIAQAGGPEVDGVVEVDQVYAHRQHEDLTYKHPHGGQAKFLEQALFSRIDTYMAFIANHVLDPDGVAQAMVVVVNDLADHAKERTPVWGDDLRRSYHLTVTENEAVVYDKPPEQHRLSQPEIREKHKLLGADSAGL